MEDFKINVFFDDDGEDIEKILASYLMLELKAKNSSKYAK